MTDPKPASAPIRPEDVLADGADVAAVGGLEVRKGTIAAFLQNALRWRAAAAAGGDRVALEEAMRAARPALTALHVFDVFELRDPELRALMADDPDD